MTAVLVFLAFAPVAAVLALLAAWNVWIGALAICAAVAIAAALPND